VELDGAGLSQGQSVGQRQAASVGNQHLAVDLQVRTPHSLRAQWCHRSLAMATLIAVPLLSLYSGDGATLGEIRQKLWARNPIH